VYYLIGRSEDHWSWKDILGNPVRMTRKRGYEMSRPAYSVCAFEIGAEQEE